MPAGKYVRTEEHREQMRIGLRSGEKCHFWEGGKTRKNQIIRTSGKYRLWRTKIFKGDDYTCQECGKRGVELNVDHIKSFSRYPELRFDMDNGRTLCVECHRKTSNYGAKAVVV